VRGVRFNGKMLIAELARAADAVDVDVGEVCIRRTKTRWSSCNAAARRIWLNLELARAIAATSAAVVAGGCHHREAATTIVPVPMGLDSIDVAR
jgi:hypothetical protein